MTFRPTGWEYSKAYRDRVEQPGGAHATEKEAAARETAAGIDEARPASQVRPDDGARPVDEPRPADEAGGGGGVWAGLPRPWVENEGRTRSYGVPYSEHSSWDELQARDAPQHNPASHHAPREHSAACTPARLPPTHARPCLHPARPACARPKPTIDCTLTRWLAHTHPRPSLLALFPII